MALRRHLLRFQQQACTMAFETSLLYQPSPLSFSQQLRRNSNTNNKIFASFFSSSKTALSSSSSSSRVASKEAVSGHSATSVVQLLRALVRDYKQLSKFKLSALVVATSAAGYAAGSREGIDWRGMGWTCLGTMLASSSANALNQLYEIANDAKMRRTANRPLPAGRMSRSHALAFAVIAGVTGISLLNEKTNTTTAALGAANIALYAAVYTPLKQISVVNTWIGAVVGAVPPLMGWAAASGSLDIGAAILASGLYFWQMPHFMALAWMCRADYAAGGYRMLSLVDAAGKRTAACALRNSAYLLPLGALATWFGVTTPYFAYESAFITGGMLLTAAKFYSRPSQANARLLFRASLLHLPIFMIAFLIHRRPNTGEDRLESMVHSARLLGFGASDKVITALESDATRRMLTPEEDDSLKGVLVPSRANVNEGGLHIARLQLPPMPFLMPAPQFSCPSKALCSDNDSMEGIKNNEKTKRIHT